MSRFLLSLFVICFLAVHAWADEQAGQVYFRFDLIHIEHDFLKELRQGENTSGGRLAEISEIEEFFILQCLREDGTGVICRGSPSCADGEPLKISNREFDENEKRRIVKKNVWSAAEAFQIEVTPSIVSRESLTLSFKYSLSGREHSLGPAKVDSGKPMLVLLESREESWFALMITPRIVLEE